VPYEKHNNSNINISDINVTDTISNSNSTTMNDKIPTKNKSISTFSYGDTELDMTLTDLNEVKSSIVNNNSELYCNNHQIAHVLQNTSIYIYILHSYSFLLSKVIKLCSQY